MELAPIFTDHMVLQRDAPIRIFGSGTGRAVVRFCGNMAEAEAAGGKWAATLPAVPAGGPYELQVSLDGADRTFQDVLVGDVFLAAGQSNMQLSLWNALGGVEQAERSDDPDLRLFTVPRFYVPDQANHPQFSKLDNRWPQWELCREETALDFSAVGYQFARRIREHRKIPVGVVSCNFGGTRIETYLKESYFDRTPALQEVMRQHLQAARAIDREAYRRAFGRFLQECELCYGGNGRSPAERVKEMGLDALAAFPLEGWPAVPYGPYDANRPAGLFHSMVEPITPFSVRAVLWYQGETNAASPEGYAEKFAALADCWREAFGQPGMPFFCVQLAPYKDRTQSPENRDWAYLREQQMLGVQRTENCYLASTQSLFCNPYDVHPIRKLEVGDRLARLALARLYGEKIVPCGPVYRKAHFRDGRTTLFFDQGEGMFRNNASPTELELAGADGRFVRAGEVELRDNCLTASAPEVPEPVAARYCFSNDAYGNIYNSAGLPMYPFRTRMDADRPRS